MKRFPDDFIFQLTENEWKNMSSQFVMTSRVKRPKSAKPSNLSLYYMPEWKATGMRYTINF